MEDPIFDPWSTDQPDGEADAPDDEKETAAEPTDSADPRAERSESPRWRSPAAGRMTPSRRVRSTPSDTLGSAAVPGARDAIGVATQPEIAAPVDAAGNVTPVDAAEGHEQTCPARERTERIRQMLLPRLEWLTGRLRTAGHKSAIDDRLDSEAPLVRIRFAPRVAPVSESRRVAASVLELAIDDSRSEIVSRIWLDPLLVEPSEEVRIRQSKASVPWLNRVLLDFVEKTLATA